MSTNSEKKLNILLIEDDPDNAIAVELNCDDIWNIQRYKHPAKFNVNDLDQFDAVLLDMVYHIKDDQTDAFYQDLRYVQKGVLNDAEAFINAVLLKKPQFPIIIMSALDKRKIHEISQIDQINRDFLYIQKPFDLSQTSFKESVEKYILDQNKTGTK